MLMKICNEIWLKVLDSIQFLLYFNAEEDNGVSEELDPLTSLRFIKFRSSQYNLIARDSC